MLPPHALLINGGIDKIMAINIEDTLESLVCTKSEIQSSIGWQFLDWDTRPVNNSSWSLAPSCFWPFDSSFFFNES